MLRNEPGNEPGGTRLLAQLEHQPGLADAAWTGDDDPQRFPPRRLIDHVDVSIAAGRRTSEYLRIVLHDPDYLTRYSARLSALRKRYSHCFQFRQTPEPLRGIADCFVLADGASGAIRFHADHFRGKLLLDRPLVIHDWQQRFEELWIESTPCTSATQLGL